MTVVRKDEEKGGGKKFRSGSIKSWPPKAAWNDPVTKRNKRRFVFDHLWGIPGGMHRQDLLLLRNLHRSNEAKKSREAYNPYIILDEQDILENRDACCNHSFGRTAREYTWHTRLHGFKYLTYCRNHLCERIIWGFFCIIAITLGIFFSARAAEFYYSSPRILRVLDEEGSSSDEHIPGITVCPSAASASNKRKEVGNQIPLMSTLWKNWDDIFEMKHDPLNSKSQTPLWINESSLKVRQLLQRIMIEGAILSYPSCSETLRKCSVSGVEVDCCETLSQELGPRGPCFTIELNHQKDKVLTESGVVKSRKIEALGEFMTHARNNLEIGVRLSGTSSKRVGYPIVNVSYWKESYLCGDSWGRKEAGVMCKSLGFAGGQKYFMNVGPAFPANNILGKLSCFGHEETISDCPTSYDKWNGNDLTTCDRSYPIALLCDSGGLQLGSNSRIRTRGKPFLLEKNNEKSYFCAEHFGDEEANVFCSMLSWKFGKVLKNYTDTKGTVSRYTNTKCTGKEAHILDCSLTHNASPTSCESVFIECSPGFPLTLRLYNPIPSKAYPNISFGYPIIDTTGREGYICDSDALINVPQVICKSQGFKHGIRIPPDIFGTPKQSILFVFDQISCEGDETSLFDCDLGVWGDHGNKEECSQVLSILCSNEETSIKAVFLDSVDYNQLSEIDTPNALIAIQILPGKYVPLCDDKGRTWSDKEADLFCRNEGFDCGLVNRRAFYALSVPISNRRYPQLLPFFASIQCNHPHSRFSEKMNGIFDVCDLIFLKGCDSGQGTSAICLRDTDPEYETCQLLREKDNASTYTSRIADFGAQERPEIKLELYLGPSIDDKGDQCTQESEGRRTHEFYVETSKEPVVIMGERSFTARIFSRTLVTSQNALFYSSPDERGCEIGVNERECTRRCEVNVSRTVCGCLPWWTFGSLGHDSKDEMCFGEKNRCLKKIEPALKFISRNVSIAIVSIEKAGLWRPEYRTPILASCSCSKSCDIHTDYDVISVDTRDNICYLSNGANTELTILIDKSRSVRYVREVFFIWEYLLGIIGGIMSIFIGFSFIVVLEIIYFFTLRWWENRKPLPHPYDSSLHDWSSKWRNERLNNKEKSVQKSQSHPDMSDTEGAFWRELERNRILDLEKAKKEDKLLEESQPPLPPTSSTTNVKSRAPSRGGRTSRTGVRGRGGGASSSRPASNKKPGTAKTFKGNKK